MILIYTILTPTLLFQILKNLRFLFLSLLQQLTLIPFEKTFILIILMFLSLMSLQPFSIIFKEKITFYLNMFLTLPPYKTIFKKNLFFTFLILNNFALLKIILTIGLPPIFFKFIIFNIIFFQNLTLNTKTKQQIQIYSLFLRKFFRHNYQIVWHSKFQTACKNFPQQFTPDELLPFLDTSDNHHPHYYNLLDFPSSHFAYLTYDSNSIDKSLNLPPSVLIPNNIIFLLRMIQFLTFLFKLFLPLHML